MRHYNYALPKGAATEIDQGGLLIPAANSAALIAVSKSIGSNIAVPAPVTALLYLTWDQVQSGPGKNMAQLSIFHQV
jgi:hypothetical protein